MTKENDDKRFTDADNFVVTKKPPKPKKPRVRRVRPLRIERQPDPKLG